MVEVALGVLESGWFFDFGIFEFIEGVANAVFEETLELIESDGLFFGFGDVFELDFGFGFIEGIEGL